jgi:gamma-glutamyl phosphate reductase
MSEVKLNSLYKVTMTEYERGYGQRDMGTKFFDNEQEAKEFCEKYFSGDSECYYRADYRKVN